MHFKTVIKIINFNLNIYSLFAPVSVYLTTLYDIDISCSAQCENHVETTPAFDGQLNGKIFL